MINTVNGIISKEELGITSPHEHIFIDMRKCVDEPKENLELFYQKFKSEYQCEVCEKPYAVIDNALMDEEDVAVEELIKFKKFGGNSIIDCTPDEIARDPEKLRRVSLKSDVNIIMGCGHYYHKVHDKKVYESTVDDLANEMINDITVGVRGTGIKSGIIGEIGTSAVVSDNEIKVLHGAGIAGNHTKKAIQVHTDLYTENGFKVVEILKSHNVKESKICIDHIDVKIRPDYIFKLLDLGVFIEFDNFGKEFYVNKNERFAYDLERVKIIKEIIDKGYINQILISNDICLKSMLCKYGGKGYAHILRTVKNMLLNEGVTEKEYNKIMIENVKNYVD